MECKRTHFIRVMLVSPISLRTVIDLPPDSEYFCQDRAVHLVTEGFAFNNRLGHLVSVPPHMIQYAVVLPVEEWENRDADRPSTVCK